MLVKLSAQPELTNTEATNIDNATERQAWREALELWTDDSPTFTGGHYTGNLLVSGKLNVGNGALDDTHIVNFVSYDDVATEVMLHLEWNSPTPLAGDSNALLFSMYDSALNETEYSRFRSVIEDPTDGTEDGAMTVDVLNDGVLEQAVLFSHDEIIMNDNGADRNFIVKDNTTAEVLRITGGTGSIAMDGSTLFVDSANNRVGVGTNTPSAGYALDVTGNTKINGYLDLDRTVDIYIGEIPSAPAFSGIWFAKNSSTATAANYSFLGDVNNTFVNGPTTLYLRTANATRATINASGIELAAGDALSFASNSGSYNGTALLTDTIDSTATNFEPLLDLATGYLGRYGPHQIDFKNGTLDTYNGSTFQPVFDYGSLTLYDYSGTQILDLWSGLTFSGTPTLAGDFNVSGQLEATGQSASTDDSVMTRSLVDEWSLDNIGRIFNLTLADLSLASSGTGAGATSTANGVRLYSGTSTSGYARATLMRGTGGWTYSTPFQRPMAAAFAITFSPASVTDTGSGIRIGFGINLTASWDSNGLTGAGFGFEYEPDGTNHRIRAIAHDGTTFTAGSWVNIGTGGTYAGHRGLLIESDGAGNISVTITAAYGDTSTTYTATTTGGPTSQASGTQSSLVAIACNESAGTPALIGCDIKAARVKLD